MGLEGGEGGGRGGGGLDFEQAATLGYFLWRSGLGEAETPPKKSSFPATNTLLSGRFGWMLSVAQSAWQPQQCRCGLMIRAAVSEGNGENEHKERAVAQGYYVSLSRTCSSRSAAPTERKRVWGP